MPSLLTEAPLQFAPAISADQKIAFGNDVVDWINQDRAGHMGPWLYSNPIKANDRVIGSLLWEEFILNSPEYYMIRDEICVLSEYARLLGDEDVRTLLDFGPGPVEMFIQKTLAVWAAFTNASQGVVVDTSKEFRENALSIMASKRPDLTDRLALGNDFFKEPIVFDRHGKVMGTVFGGTAFNIEIQPDLTKPVSLDEIRSNIAALIKAVGTNGELIATSDTNENWGDILRSYMNERHKRFCQNLAFRMQRDLDIEGDFDPRALTYEAVPYPDNFILAHTLKAERDMRFRVNGQAVRAIEGCNYAFNTSVKMPNDETQGIYGDAGGRVLETFPANQNRITANRLIAA